MHYWTQDWGLSQQDCYLHWSHVSWHIYVGGWKSLLQRYEMSLGRAPSWNHTSSMLASSVNNFVYFSGYVHGLFFWILIFDGYLSEKLMTRFLYTIILRHYMCFLEFLSPFCIIVFCHFRVPLLAVSCLLSPYVCHLCVFLEFSFM